MGQPATQYITFKANSKVYLLQEYTSKHFLINKNFELLTSLQSLINTAANMQGIKLLTSTRLMK